MEPPTSRLEWKKLADTYGSPFQTIHQLDSLKSGSKIGQQQFLALRVIWKNKKAFDVKYGRDWGLPLGGAMSNLMAVRGWREYCQTVQTSGLGDKPEFGRFDLLWSFQKQVNRITHSSPGSDKISSPPISSRTRQGIASRPNISADQPSSSTNPFSTPGPTTGTRQPFKISSRLDAFPIPSPSQMPQTPTKATIPSSGWDELSDEDDDGSPMDGVVTDRLSPASASESYQYPPADDEQTVNTALILALNAVCLSQHDLIGFPWSLERKAFTFKTTEKLYEARTDGHLRFQKGKMNISLAILEVKAGLRSITLPHAQESAQMAAWIHAEPDVKRTRDGIYRRLMISQDRHEVYIIIAEYDDEYVHYLNTGIYNDKVFMTMHELGPFGPEDDGHMDILGSCLQSFTSKLLENAHQGNPFRW